MCILLPHPLLYETFSEIFQVLDAIRREKQDGPVAMLLPCFSEHRGDCGGSRVVNGFTEVESKSESVVADSAVAESSGDGNISFSRV
ncbi:hypothetical protein F2Q68_00032430 [Brassica cretica]|uniref:Uncharacterized protein n=1 Tax=Brassica cretica TaxID=69181 RepID=A0A8S9GI52_BRACR|nr:hypothetical protein F2Q68_00032430 [Brassica cretica]